jgi:hypothetical protein
MRDNPSSRWWTSGWNSTTPPGRCSLPAPDQTPSPGPGAGRSSAACSRPPYGPMVPAPVDDAGTDQVTRTHPRDHHPSIRPGGVTGSLRRGGIKVAVPQLQPLRAGAPQGEQSRSRTGGSAPGAVPPSRANDTSRTMRTQAITIRHKANPAAVAAAPTAVTVRREVLPPGGRSLPSDLR